MKLSEVIFIERSRWVHTIFIPTSRHFHSLVSSGSRQLPKTLGGKNFWPTNCAYAVLVIFTDVKIDVLGGKRFMRCAACRIVNLVLVS